MGVSVGAADGAAVGAAAQWSHDLPHTEETFPGPSLRFLSHFFLLAHPAQVFLFLDPSILNVPFLVFVTQDLPHTEETFPLSLLRLLLHLPLFAHPLQFLFLVDPSTLNVPFLVLVQLAKILLAATLSSDCTVNGPVSAAVAATDSSSSVAVAREGNLVMVVLF